MSSGDRPYKIVIGLEVHVQLATESKLFCGCSTQFGAPPNTQTCPVCSGQPGALPVMNRRAIELSLLTAIALNCDIPPMTKWDRKQYFYPDLPKDYQISQFDLPLSSDGWLDIVDEKERFQPKRIGIIRAHLEEDAGKSMHDEEKGRADSRIDLNRCGTPLLEIVSHPHMNSPEEAYAYLTQLKLLLTYLGVSDCNMQEGSLRADSNINLHIDTPDGVVATPICEVKNLNSFRAVERAMAYEAERQYDEWKQTGIVLGGPGGHKTTRGWDDGAQVTRPQRTKEESSDYRYFPDPDLVPLYVTQEQVAEIRSNLPELPAALHGRLQEEYNLSDYDAGVLVNQGRALVDYFLETTQLCGDAKSACNWISQEVLRELSARNIEIGEFLIRPKGLAGLIDEIKSGALTTSRAKDVLADMLESGRTAAESMKELGIEAVDSSAIESLCRQLLEANPKTVTDVKEGKLKAVGALIGQAKKVNPNVQPNEIRETCLRLIEDM